MAGQLSDKEQRPSPEALLAEMRREERGGSGRLKIFVGAAPGVGKTYEMLQTARAKRKEGVDVVVGVVETHGRKETEALLEGFEILPRKPTIYVNRILDEFDIDAALKRRPSLILVDELAHTNVPGSRHPKRYQDVEELLAAGIDVYTAVNIQHIQSLKEGKVYVPKQAERALKNYFSPANLTALRELALRRTAERVDEQLLEHMRARAIRGPWAAGDRIIVCVSEDPRSSGLVRYAKRLADRLHAPWTAVYVETSRAKSLGDEPRNSVARTLRLVETLEGEALTMPASARRIADDILETAYRLNATHIIIGKSMRSRWFEMVHGSVVHDLVRRSGNISVHVIAGEELATEPAPPKPQALATAARPFDPLPYIVALLAVVAALGVGKLVQPIFGLENVDLIFLTGIVGVALRYGLWPSLLATLAASLSYNFFFLPPLYTFSITDPTNLAAFILFTLLAVVVSNLAAQGWNQSIAARERVRMVESLYAFSRKLAGAGTLDDVLWATAYQIASMLQVRVVLLLPDHGSIALRAGYPPEDRLEEADLAAAKWAWEKNRPAGRDSDALPGAKWLFMPMRTGRGQIGILGICRDAPGLLLSAEQRRLLDALSDQGALAIQRVHLVEDIDRVKRTAETDRLRSALLTSISHDLKTPLAAVLGAAGALRDLSKSFDENAKADLLATIIEESERLNRFIANLLDMTKLESGAVVTNAALHDVGEIVGSALQRAGKLLAKHRVEMEISSDLPLVRVDAVLFEQALFNLLDNAAKYAPPATTIRVQCWRDEDSICVQIFDEGDGIPARDLERIFDKFYRVQKGDQVRAGTGLGLAIARGFVEAMQGTISAGNRTDRPGAVFTITLPAPEPGEQGKAAA